MKILYFISVHGHGRGGHFHSLDHISRKVGEKNDVKIITFGPGRSDIIESNPHFLKHIVYNGLNNFHINREIKNVSRYINPDIFHCFDEGSYNIVRLIISSRKSKIIVTKCGGPNPGKFPKIHNIIVFSEENMDWFKSQPKYYNSKIHLIPNRVLALINDQTFTPIRKVMQDFVFMRIGRICSRYKKSILDSISLIEILLSKNIRNVRLFIIGEVQDVDLYQNIKKHYLMNSNHVVLLTETKFISEASKMLYLADAVIGTGRGLMESASLAIPILALDSKGSIPVLIDQENFQDAFKTNFSERNIFTTLNKPGNVDNIIKLVQNKNYYNEMSNFSKYVFEEHFNLNIVEDSYPLAYKQAIFGQRAIISDLRFIVRSMKYFHRSSLKIKNN